MSKREQGSYRLNFVKGKDDQFHLNKLKETK